MSKKLLHEKGHKIYWDDENGIVRSIEVGVLDSESSSWFIRAIDQMADAFGEQLLWLGDVTQVTKSTLGARKMGLQIAAHASVRKFAIVGTSPYVKTVTNFIISMVGKNNLKIFSSQEEAIYWLKEGNHSG